MTNEFYESEYNKILNQVTDELGYIGDIIDRADEIKSETDLKFEQKFGFEYAELID